MAKPPKDEGTSERIVFRDLNRRAATDPDDEPTKPEIDITPSQGSPDSPGSNPNGGFDPQDFGLIDSLMKDPEITEIMVNDTRNVIFEKGGRMFSAGLSYSSLEELHQLVKRILDLTGRVLNPDYPYLDAMLPDGSRVNIVAPPLTLHGPCLTIRKFPHKALGIEDLIQLDMLDRRLAHFFSICVGNRLNILISGGTGSGKTTLLNGLISFIPRVERVLTIEDTPELSLPHTNSVRMQTKPQSATSGAVLTRELLANALRMRPDRIIIGECRRSEAFDMLQAMNTGHEGSMATLHANSPRDALSRLETLCMTAGVDLPLLAIRKQIEGALDLIIQTRRMRNGKRRVVAVTEVTGIEGDTITLQDIFVFDPDQRPGTQGEAGAYRSTGMVPTFITRFRENGIELPKNYFA